MNQKEAVAIITARGGSKRIPRKNVLPFLGKPIINYSIQAAIDAKCFSTVMVSTDDDEIAQISKECGAEVPFRRSKENSDDHSTTADVLREVILEYQKRGENYKYLCCIYPTAPFVTAARLDQGLDIMKRANAQALVSIVRFGFPIQRALHLTKDGLLEMLWPENRLTRSQDLEPTFHDAGQFYWLEVESFLKHHSLYLPVTIPMEIPETESQDIDSRMDWELAEIKYRMAHPQA